MLRVFYIARGEDSLGKLTGAETVELLRAGFLRPTDLLWTDGMSDWETLAVFKPEPEDGKSPAALLRLAKQSVQFASKATVSQAARFGNRLKSVIGDRRSRWEVSANQMLDAFTPQIQKLVSAQLVKHSVACVQAAIHDDAFMRKLFGAAYDCLPKPIHRFVTEEAFIRYCMERRRKLLAPPSPESQER